MKAKLQLSGRSGCKLELEESQGRVLVKKYSNSLEYNSRLIKQAEKQAVYFGNAKSKEFNTPRILATYPGNNEELAWVKMEYVFGEKYSDYLEKISVPDLKLLGIKFQDYFQKSLDGGEFGRTPYEAINDKLSSLQEKFAGRDAFNEEVLEKTFSYLSLPPSDTILLGSCHGDFTLSNIVFQTDRIFLIDFLDSFIESPVQDIVKFRQDTLYFWSIMLEKDLPLYRINKLKQVLKFLDSVAKEVLQNNPGAEAWYAYLQTFNLLRILPYLKEEKEIRFVENSLIQNFRLCS